MHFNWKKNARIAYYLVSGSIISFPIRALFGSLELGCPPHTRFTCDLVSCIDYDMEPTVLVMAENSLIVTQVIQIYKPSTTGKTREIPTLSLPSSEWALQLCYIQRIAVNGNPCHACWQYNSLALLRKTHMRCWFITKVQTCIIPVLLQSFHVLENKLVSERKHTQNAWSQENNHF